ncbi:hypothetical protein AMELA_G00087630 [Ameiurus melas]|uniref:Uncharacterized protein n=1 Tax=Ameiurus melas TaxID=219545 RepID=A0A7J6AYT7_AMEME|nr:hypothetical protein AMELA_G00087630 [Ameiurus melas]
MESKGASGCKKLPLSPDSSLHLLPQLPKVRGKPKWQDVKPSFVLLGQAGNTVHGVPTRISRETLRGSMQHSQRARSTARVSESFKRCVKSKKDREELRRTLISIFT